MKIYAKQIPPENQESPLFLGPEFFPDNIAVFGNRHYKEHVFTEFDNVRNALDDDLCYLLRDFRDNNDFDAWAEALLDFVPPYERGPYTREEIEKSWPDLLDRFWYNSTGDNNAFYCEALALVTGKKWGHKTLHGCCQGDWQYIIYAVDEWSEEALAAFEVEYFNTGTEWMIEENDTDPPFSMYCTSWNNDGIRAEIAAVVGCAPDDIVLQKFTGWTKTPNYTTEEI